MKKITSFLTFALLFGGFSTAKADIDPDLLNMKAIVGVDTPIEDASEIVVDDEWYAISQLRGKEGFMYDNSANEQGVVRYSRASIYPSDKEADGVGTGVLAPMLVRFVEGSIEGTYNIMFGTGNYISTEKDARKLLLGNMNTAADFLIYVANEAPQPGLFAINFATGPEGYGDKVDTEAYHTNDMAYVVTWATGKTTYNNDHEYTPEGSGSNNANNNIWRIYPVELVEYTAEEAANEEFRTFVNEYNNKVQALDGMTSDDGTPGTYDDGAWNEAYLYIQGILDVMNDNQYTLEQIAEMREQIVTLYNTLNNSYISSGSDITPGYYFIATHKKFYEDVAVEGSEETTRVFSNRYLLARQNGASANLKWGVMPENASKIFNVWHVTKPEGGADKQYRVENVQTKTTLYTENGGTALDTLKESPVEFTEIESSWYGDDETSADTTFYSIHFAVDRADKSRSFHAGGHGNGANKEGNIVRWSYEQSDGGIYSQWALLPVSEDEVKAMIAAYAEYEEEMNFQDKAKAILAEVGPKLAIALDNSSAITGDSLISDTTQFSSPYGETTEAEHSFLCHLLDGNENTIWHSTWSDASLNSIATGHYLQVELVDPAAVQNVALVLGRRKVVNDHPVQFDVYSSDDPELDKSAWTFEGIIRAPFSGQGKRDTTTVVATGGKKYLRFYASDCTPSFRTYWHATYFQLFPATVVENPTSQAKAMGDIFTNMQAAFYAAKVDPAGAVTKEHYDALAAAAEAFNARFVNPDTLRNTIADNEDAASLIVIGNKPGEWPADPSAAYNAVIAAAKTYDKAGNYSLENSRAQIKAIEDARKAMFGAANGISTDKWYTFNFPTEEFYEKYNLSTNGAVGRTAKGNNKIDIYPELFGKRIAVGEDFVEGVPGTGDTIVYDHTNSYFPSLDTESIIMGNRMYLMNPADYAGEGLEDRAMFRFIKANDSTYYIQNKASGLYLRSDGSGAVTLNVQPSMWKNSAMGGGKFMCTSYNIEGGTNEHNNLHVQRDGSFVVAWSATNIDSNTGFLLEEAGEVGSFDGGNTVRMSLMPNSINAFCYPVEMSPVNGKAYGVQSIVDGEITLSIYQDNKVPGGQSFFYVTGTGEYDEEAEPKTFEFTYGTDMTKLVAKADTIGYHVGSYYYTSAPFGSIIANGEGKFTALRSETEIGSNTAWIDAKLENPRATTLTVKYDEGTFDSIKDAIVNVNKNGKIYTADGTYVGKGNINTVQGLKKGLYIVNGVKVLVK